MPKPPEAIPDELQHEFTMNFTIPIYPWYIDDTVGEQSPVIWSKECIRIHQEAFTNNNILERKSSIVPLLPYHDADKHILESISDISLNNHSIAVIGSITPWIEAILLNNGATDITTVEFNVPIIDNHPFLKAIHYDNFAVSDRKYDYIFSYSSIEHSGLGRYGDPLNPNGDLETMSLIHSKLNKRLFLGIPIGQDSLVWNAHRIYGSRRLELMLKGFEVVRWIGYRKEDVLDKLHENQSLMALQPLLVLDKNK